MSKKIIPLFDQVILELIKNEKSIIVLDEKLEAKIKQDQYKVIDVGPEVKYIKVGDRVIFRCPHFSVGIDGKTIVFNNEKNACLAERTV